MDSNQAKKVLLQAFQSHHIAVSEDDVQRALDTREILPDLVGEYLGPETFLSREEVELFAKLQKDGTARRIAESFDLCLVRSLPEEEIEDATRKLRSSTAAIEQQTRMLKAQQEALTKIQEDNRRTHLNSKQAAEIRQRKRLQEMVDTSQAVKDMLRSISFTASTACRQVQSLHDTSPKMVADLLQHDDKILSRMNELISELPDLEDENEVGKIRVEILTTRLATFISDEIRCRLDRTYLEAIDSFSTSNHTSDSEHVPHETSLKAELGTLYTEIGDVAQMFVDQAFTMPFSQATTRKSILREKRIEIVLKNVEENIDNLGKKICLLNKRLCHHDSHLEALNIISRELRNLNLTMTQDASMSPLKKGNHHLSDISKDTDLSEHGVAEENGEDFTEPSHRRLLRSLGCPPLQDSNMHSMQDTLDNLVYDMSQKAKQAANNLDTTIDLILASHLDAASCTTQLILDAVLEDTPYQTTHLLDERLRLRVAKLETEVNKIGSGMENLGLDQLNRSSEARDAFVNRWDV